MSLTVKKMRPLSCGLRNGIRMKLCKTLNKQKMGSSQYSHSYPKGFFWCEAQKTFARFKIMTKETTLKKENITMANSFLESFNLDNDKQIGKSENKNSQVIEKLKNYVFTFLFSDTLVFFNRKQLKQTRLSIFFNSVTWLG